MEITSLGHSSFRIKGKTATLVTDPFDSEMVGFPFPRHVSADIVTVSHEHKDHNAVNAIEGSPFVIQGPGEYEIKGVSVIGVSSYHDAEKGEKRGKNIIYRIEIDGISVVHLGDLGGTLSTSEIERLDGVDILMIPVGGDVTIDSTAAAALLSEIDPAIVIPMHYKTKKHNEKIFGTLSPVSVFLKAIDKEDLQPQPKLSVTKDKLPTERQVVVLE